MRKKIGLMILIICTSILTATIAYGADLVISTAAELRNFATAVNGGNDYSGKTVELANDINLGSTSFEKIGNSASTKFAGTFDGINYKITGLYISNNNGLVEGLFGYIDTAGVVKNITVSGSVTAVNSVGGIAGNCMGTIENCISNVSVTASGTNCGGICGQLYSGAIIENCINKGTISGNEYNTGGIVGSSSGNIISCTNNGTVKSSKQCIGGIAASVSGGTITDCSNTGTISCSGCDDGNTYVSLGGIVGYSSGEIIINRCQNSGKIQATYTGSEPTYRVSCKGIGGILGRSHLDYKFIIKDSYNKGDITNISVVGGNWTGGIFGGGGNNSCEIENCYNTGNISAQVQVGGIAGAFSGTIENVYNMGNVNHQRNIAGGNIYVGGIVGQFAGQILRYAYSTGTITANGR